MDIFLRWWELCALKLYVLSSEEAGFGYFLQDSYAIVVRDLVGMWVKKYVNT